ncbi:calcium/proton exchanger [Cryptococcus decagattii]|uniref:Calcium/proton exchanger n=1 Tax=Cryptococcus decagattii TaxID=1859122 RepID=A0ABZ2AQH0_9TREE
MATLETSPLLPSQASEHTPVSKPFDLLGSTRYLLLGSWINVLLICVPLSFAAEGFAWSAAARFTTSFLAIVPLAKLLGDSTEQLSMKLGQTLGGLLNATFGNAVELIVAIAALRQDELDLVQRSLLGSVLSNLLLVLGMSFFAAGFFFYESTFQATAAQASSSLMTLACITLILPAAYHASEIDNGSSLVGTLLGKEVSDLSDRSLKGLLLLSRGTSVILLLTYFGYLYFQLRTHSGLFEAEIEETEEMEVAEMDQWSAGTWLLIITIHWAHPSPSCCVGSSIQIAAGMIPLLVIIAWPLQKDLTLFFANFETIVLFVSVMLVNLLLQDGRSNYMEGVMLMSLYLVIALSYLV